MRLRLVLALGVWLSLGACRLAVAAPSATNFFALDAGFFANNVVGRANALEADKADVSHFSIYGRLRRGLHLGKQFYFEPALATLIPWYASVDGNTKQFIFHSDFAFLVPFFSFLKLRLGPGLEWQWIVTSAATVELGNGTQTSAFYIPGGNRLAILATVQLGFEARVFGRICLNLDLRVLAVASPTRRSYQVSAGLGVYL